ncbi:hypothetical protein NQ317_006157, partial [Molorchus minor]
MSRSEYYLTLSGSVKCRYDDKIKVIDNIDPYALGDLDLSADLSILPRVSVIDMVNYLVLTHSFYTGLQLKAYKSLQAYKFYEAGFVQEVKSRKINTNAFVAVGKVKHSQKMREKPLQAWLIVLADGAVSSAHCTCMAGLGEVCSHVAAMLFYLEARPYTIEQVACTESLARWPIPSTRGVEMLRVRDMAWANKGRQIVPQLPALPLPLGKEDVKSLIQDLMNVGITPAIARVYEPFASQMMQIANTEIVLLNTLFNPYFVDKLYDEILSASNSILISCNEEEIQAVEKATRGQAQSSVWFQYRSGRITASTFKAVCRARVINPPLSLLKRICYPQKMIFSSKQTSYGMNNEKNALEEYKNEIQKLHENISITNVGFYISSQHPEFGASPDALVSCDCCGMGCVEIKCPYVQLQMFATKLKYCDFVIWSENVLFIERIDYDEDFLNMNIEKAFQFYKYVVKPELLSRFFTNKLGLGRVQTWCVCKKPDDSRPMLQCDNDECDIGWYHFECIGISVTDTPDNV